MIHAGFGRLVRIFALAALCANVATTHAVSPDEVAQSRSDLRDVQGRIRELEQAIAETETERSTAARKLAQAERAVSAVRRRIRKLEIDVAAAEKDLAAQVSAQELVEERIAGRRGELASWVKRHYLHGGSDVAPFLLARDPNQLARDARYLEHLGRARVALIEALRADLRERSILIASIAQRRDGLLALGQEQLKQRRELERVQKARTRVLAGLTEQLRSQQKEIESLRYDEQQLGRLVEVLIQQSIRRERARAAAARAAHRDEGTQPRPARTPSDSATTQPQRGLDSSIFGARFADLRGRMPFPVRGELIGRFGAPRAQGGTRWRGVFIRARDGDDVQAVAGGEVVFSDWLRGYGNLIIIDHGDDYLTIYGNNDSLFSLVGDRIPAGAPIASVGASGGEQESGLYFEIRHQGQPVDPLLWVGVR